jgi:phosphonate transport system substrate-binding protein
MKNNKTFTLLSLVFLSTLSALSTNVFACKALSDNSSNASVLCDENEDMLADLPKDKKDWITPKTLNLAFATIEDASFYEQVYGDFVNHLQQCMSTPVLIYPVYQEAHVIEAMKSGKIHIASFGAGATILAVNQAGAVPFASRGTQNQNESYQLLLIVRKNSGYKQPSDLKGKKIAHTTPSSNSGNLAPRALFPDLGLKPEVDYNVEFSGRHDKSIMGVKNGFYDAAAVASDVFKRMILSKEINENDFNIIWKSSGFPTNSFSYYHKLNPLVTRKLQQCFYKYKFSEKNKVLLNGNDEFVPVTYSKDWALVRKVSSLALKKDK